MLPENKQLDLQRTYTQQQNLINKDIIPSIMKTINQKIFPITNEVIYDMIHSLHRHRREEHLKYSRPSSEMRVNLKRKHSSSRRHDVSKLVWYIVNICFNANFLSNTETNKMRKDDQIFGARGGPIDQEV